MNETITAWSLAWRSRVMPAAAFWYFRSEGAARGAAAALGTDCKYTIREVQVRSDFSNWSDSK